MIKKVSIFLVLVVLVVIAYIFINQKSVVKNAQYHNEPTKVSLEYPSYFQIEERIVNNDELQPGIILTSKGDRIAIAIQVKPIIDAEIEKAYYNTVLFADAAGKMRNSEVSIGGFTGYKTLFDFTKSQYFLFKQGQATSTLVLQIETTTSDPNRLLMLEDTLREILTSTVFNY